MTFSSNHLSISTNRPVTEVYKFASNPENLPLWVAGISNSIEKDGEDWVTESPMGKVKIRFANANIYGILDHEVI